MRHSRTARPVLASFVSGVVALVPLFALALSELFAQPVILATGEADDAAMRGSGLVLLSLPFIYLITVAVAFVSSYLLLQSRYKSLRAFLMAALAVAGMVALCIAAVAAPPGRSTALETLLVFVFTFVLAAISSLPAAGCWWLLGAKGNDA
jgi:hypothetical protein